MYVCMYVFIYLFVSLYVKIAADFRQKIEDNNMTIIISETFTDNPASQIKHLKVSD